jgi:hypothetical protein
MDTKMPTLTVSAWVSWVQAVIVEFGGVRRRSVDSTRTGVIDCRRLTNWLADLNAGRRLGAKLPLPGMDSFELWVSYRDYDAVRSAHWTSLGSANLRNKRAGYKNSCIALRALCVIKERPPFLNSIRTGVILRSLLRDQPGDCR